MRTLTTECTKITVAHIHKGSLTKPGVHASMTWDNGSSVSLSSGPNCLHIHYGIGRGESRQSHSDRIDYHWQPCHFGGSRLYLRCPVCRRKCMAVYGAAPFACRTCHGLAYPSETVSGHYRLYDTGQKIAHKLAGRFVTLDEPFPYRPKGMHRKTYARLKSKWARMTDPARAMFNALWQDEGFAAECNDRWEKREREYEARLARTAAFHELYWSDKPQPAKGLQFGEASP